MDRDAGPRVPIWMALARVVFGLLLLADAALEWQPGTYQVFDSLIYANASVSPQPLRGALVFAAELMAHQPAVANGMLAAVETALAASVLLGLWAGLSLLLAVPLFLGIWVFGQGMGLPFASGTTDLNSGIPYVLVALLLWLGRSWQRLSLWAWIRGSGGPDGRRLGLAVGASVLGLAILALLTFGSVSAVDAGPGVAGPPAVGAAVLSYDPHLGEDLLFGGCNALTCSDQTWVWEGRAWRRDFSPVSPPPIAYAASAYYPPLRAVVVFGGAESEGVGAALSSTWAWADGWRRLRDGGGPSPRRLASMAYDPSTQQLVLFGGDDSSGHPLGETWVLSRNGWKQLFPPVSPSPRTAASMAWDQSTGLLILYGGSSERGRLDGTWAWNGATWRRLSPARTVGPLAYEAMASDPQNGSVLLFAGVGARRSTWTWTGTDWRFLASTERPPVFSFEAMAPAPAGRGVLLFGGATSSGSGFSAQTWLWTTAGWSLLNGPG